LTPLADNPNQRAIIGDWSIANVDQRTSLSEGVGRAGGVSKAYRTRSASISAAWRSPIEALYKTLKQKRKVVDDKKRLLDHAKQISSWKVTAKLPAKLAA
jgi:hypothetical protein